MILPTAGLILAMSALARTMRLAGLGFFFVFLGTEVTRGIVLRATRSSYSSLMSIQGCMRGVSEAVFDLKPTRVLAGLPPELAAMALLVLFGSCLLVLRTRVRAVEIVR